MRDLEDYGTLLQAITDTANFEKFKVQHSRGHSFTQTSTLDFLSGSPRQLYLDLL